MGLFDNGFPKTLPALAVSVGVALVTPVVLVAAASLLRPLAKTAIKGGFMVRDAAVHLYGAVAEDVHTTTPAMTAIPPLVAEPASLVVESVPTPESTKPKTKPRKDVTVSTAPKPKKS